MTKKYLIKRLLITFALLFTVITINFFLPRVMPNDPTSMYTSDPRLSDEAKEEIKAQFGLDKPLIVQYGLYLKNLAKGDLGTSFIYRKPVIDVIASRVPWTLVLTLSSTLISIVFGILYGAYASWKRGGRAESILLATSIIISALPTFWIALMLIFFFGFKYPIFPPYGMVDINAPAGFNFERIFSIIRHAFLPVLSMSIGSIIGYAVLVRNSMLFTVSKSYIKTAKAKGLSSNVVLFKHAFRNALLPLVTRIGLSLAKIIGGAVIIENIFSWQGMGTLIIDASRGMDYPLMQGCMLILATLTLIAIFLTDIVYAKLDPRIQFE